MNLRKAITRDAIRLELESSEKSAIIEELVDVLVSTGKISDRKSALKAVLEREKKMSTGMHHGIAIPHGKTETVSGLVAAIGIKKEGVDFQALDGNDSRIFIMTISPANRAGPHIQFLAEISRLLNEEHIREKILAAGSADEIYDTILSG
ncbi:MAG: fructose-specific phosphotransferase system IIA component [Kiritimatiellia bacterium]|jgi:fructose-specific phosphotransferase system IIA component